MLIYNVYVVENGGRYPIGNDFTMHFNWLSCLLEPSYLKASTRAWSHAFCIVCNVWHWSPLSNCTNKLFCKSDSVQSFLLKQRLRCASKTANGLLFALNELYVWVQEIFVLNSPAFVIRLLLLETLLESDKIRKNRFSERKNEIWK